VQPRSRSEKDGRQGTQGVSRRRPGHTDPGVLAEVWSVAETCPVNGFKTGAMSHPVVVRPPIDSLPTPLGKHAAGADCGVPAGVRGAILRGEVGHAR
jgi:hypothetical protein